MEALYSFSTAIIQRTRVDSFNQRFTFSQLCKLQVQDQGVRRIDFFPPWEKIAISSVFTWSSLYVRLYPNLLFLKRCQSSWIASCLITKYSHILRLEVKTSIYEFGGGGGGRYTVQPIVVSVQFSCSVVSDSAPGLPVYHQTHVHCVSDAIQPSHPLSSPSPGLNLFQHQGLFKWVSSPHQVARVLEYWY